VSKSFKLAVQANQRVFINGAVLRFDRKVALEFLNNATFLLDTYVLQPEQVTSPLRQLYFVIQTMLMDPPNRSNTLAVYAQMLTSMLEAFENPRILHDLKEVDVRVQSGRDYDALKMLRQMFELEAQILESGSKPAACEPSDLDDEVALPLVRTSAG
jgi:flagellar protein FlbT